jgi:hypothetical protein
MTPGPLSRRSRLTAIPLLAALVLAGCGGGGDKAGTKDAQASLRQEVGAFTGVVPNRLNHTVTALECPGSVKKRAAYDCGVSLSDGLAGTVHVIPGAGKTISWSAVLRHDGTTVHSAQAG